MKSEAEIVRSLLEQSRKLKVQKEKELQELRSKLSFNKNKKAYDRLGIIVEFK